jgi:Mg-chelatase subunit ChlI
LTLCLSVKSKLIDWFDPEPTESTAIAALSNCRIDEHETIKDHLIRFSELVGEAGDSVTPRMILHFYMASLRTKTKEWLEDINERTPLTFEEAAKLARGKEERLALAKNKSKHETSTATAPVASSHQSSSNERQQQQQQQQQRVQQQRQHVSGVKRDAEGRQFQPATRSLSAPPTNAQSMAESLRRRETVRCYNCNVMGHYSNECPEPPKPKKIKTKVEISTNVNRANPS